MKRTETDLAYRLGPDDATLVERLIAGESIDDLVAAETPQRAERVSRLLALLEAWPADDAEPGLADRAFLRILHADPVSIDDATGRALDALLDLRREGLDNGPMPADTRATAGSLVGVMDLLDRAKPNDDEPIPGGLAERTLRRIERDRDRDQERRRSRSDAMSIGGGRLGGGSIRQVATTAALLLMVLSVLLPMLDNGRRNALVAQCSQNLAGLGSDLQQLAFDRKGATTPNAPASDAGVFDPLSRFAQTDLDGSTIPAANASLFILVDQRRVTSEHLTCPATEPNDPAGVYNGQNPVVGGPFRIFLEPRPIFADTNPLYRVTPRGLVRNVDTPGLTRSRNHDGIGQNVLISDGSVKWMVRPAVNQHDTSDNIWLYQPQDRRDNASDIFLTP